MDRPFDRAATVRGWQDFVAQPARRMAGALAARRWTFGLADAVGIGVAIIVAFDIRYERLDGFEPAIRWLPITAAIVLIRTIVHARLGLYQRLWRYATLADFLRVAVAIVAGTLISVAFAYAIAAPLGVRVTGFPLSFWPIEAMLSLGTVAGPRFVLRATREFRTTGYGPLISHNGSAASCSVRVRR